MENSNILRRAFAALFWTIMRLLLLPSSGNRSATGGGPHLSASMTALATDKTVSASALLFTELAREDRRRTFPGTYPTDGSFLSIVADSGLLEPVPMTNFVPKTGHDIPDGSGMSASVMQNSRPAFLALHMAVESSVSLHLPSLHPLLEAATSGMAALLRLPSAHPAQRDRPLAGARHSMQEPEPLRFLYLPRRLLAAEVEQ